MTHQDTENAPRRAAVAVRLDQAIVMNRGQGEGEWRGTLRQLVADNGDDLDEGELADICDALALGEIYTGGGGAAAEFTVEAA